MIAALSAVSSKALWILTDDQATQILATQEWNDSESTDLSAKVEPEFQKLLKKAQTHISQIKTLAAVTGPGAFTALRVSNAFVQGLSRALNIPTIAIPTFDLVNEVFQIPLQHQRFKNLEIKNAERLKVEVLKILSHQESEISLIDLSLKARGFFETPEWPSSQELLTALKKNLEKSSQDRLTLQYGLNPKISGQRI